MLKKTAWIALLCAQFILSQGAETSKAIAKKIALERFENTCLTSSAIYSALKIADTAYKVGKAVTPKDPVEAVRAKAVKNGVQFLEAEESLKKCLVDNVLRSRQNNLFPSACRSQMESFGKIASIEELNTIQHEFVESSSRILAMSTELEKRKEELEKSRQPGMSTTKKVVIGGLAVGVFWWLGGPAIVATKLIAAKGAIVTATAGATVIAADVATVAIETVSNIDPRAAVTNFAALEKGNQFKQAGGVIIGTAGVIEKVEFVTNMVYTSDEERLTKLLAARQMQPPLFDRMKSAHIKDPK